MMRAWFFAAFAILSFASEAVAEIAQAKQGMVASVHPLATDAGVKAMRDGGNAIDAAVAVAFTLGVVDGHNSGIGGGCFMLIRLANGDFVAIDGREMAPAAAQRDMFVIDGEAKTELSQNGALAVAVPGALAAYQHALTKHGRKTLAEVISPAADIAEAGFPLDEVYARKLKANAGKLKKFDVAAKLFFHSDGSPLKEGDTLIQPDLAKSYRAIAEQGTDWFYRGEFATKVAEWMRENDGLITQDDFQNYQLKEREPIRTPYRDYEIVTFPPPSSGGVHVAQILNMLENFDMQQLANEPVERTHIIAEAMKLAFADRAYWLGDPDFAKVPKGLVDKSYAKKLAGRIDRTKVIDVESHDLPPDAETRLFGKHTTHFSTADAEGNWVACTATINTAFGSKVIVPGTGILLNNEMDDFSVQPGVPNHFKLVGAEANAIAPGKRPLSSMSPTIVLKKNQPVLSLGGSGGPKIITQTVLNLVRILDLQMPLHEALGDPRFHHQWLPNELSVERTMPEEIQEGLKKFGHELKLVGPAAAGTSQVIEYNPEEKLFYGAHDPRVPGKASGF